MKKDLFYFILLVLFSLFVINLSSLNIYAFEVGFSFNNLYISSKDFIQIRSVYFNIINFYTYNTYKKDCWGFLFDVKLAFSYYTNLSGSFIQIAGYQILSYFYFIGISFPIIADYGEKISKYPQLSIGVEAVAVCASYGFPHSVNDIAISTICLAAKANSLNQTLNLGIFIKNITGFYINKSGTFLDDINFYWYINFGISF